MSEEEAERLVCQDVPRETCERLKAFINLLRDEAEKQNLIARSTLDQIWQRHILDSSQLLGPTKDAAGPWVDIGSGAGLPGLVIAILRDQPCLLIEPRAKRAAFLSEAIERLGLASRVTVIAQTAASAPAVTAAVISARAVAPLPRLFAIGARFADAETIWVLPKGRSAAEELASARASWQGEFRLVPSLTDSCAAIVVARGVRPRKTR
ncbi:16S rRNA (guanine(527)-N(7))-methyltransferase RsmG [Sphingomonas bacterium]|uniref:16S rRNA (guanine(527)-N(7))-methyltransferase RsmG n=1 Tax=Sphingomonas bacterium TaxID=1895847 RepID=UPI00157715A5|nr:16S rRNA (guanine(527)-N(7))-methyltransferase RsmG [Sphingomonas bacterium]